MLLTPDPLWIQTAAWAPGQHVLLPLLLQNLTFGGFPRWNNGMAFSGSISTVLTGLSWICLGMHRRRVLFCPVCA